MTQAAPLQYDIDFKTTAGDFVLRVPQKWSPIVSIIESVNPIRTTAPCFVVLVEFKQSAMSHGSLLFEQAN